MVENMSSVPLEDRPVCPENLQIAKQEAAETGRGVDWGEVYCMQQCVRGPQRARVALKVPLFGAIISLPIGPHECTVDWVDMSEASTAE